MFNYYYIDYLDELILDYPQHQPTFEVYQINLEFCQAITLVTAFILYFIPKGYCKHTFTIDQFRCIIMGCSFYIKIALTLYQLFYYYNIKKYHSSELGLKLDILEVSYLIRFIIMVVMIIILMCTYLEKCINFTSKWAKNYKVTYIEEIEIDRANLDDV